MVFTPATHSFNIFFGLERLCMNDSSHVDNILRAIKDLIERCELDEKDPRVLFDIFRIVLMKFCLSECKENPFGRPLTCPCTSYFGGKVFYVEFFDQTNSRCLFERTAADLILTVEISWEGDFSLSNLRSTFKSTKGNYDTECPSFEETIRDLVRFLGTEKLMKSSS